MKATPAESADGITRARPAAGGATLLTTHPPVLWMHDFNLSTRGTQARRIFEAIRWRRPHVLISPTWSHRNKVLAKRLKRKLKYWALNPRRVVILANESEEIESFEAVGLRAILCNHNAMISEQIFKPIESPKEFEAIYDAALTPFKRHELARDVESLALISYVKSTDSMEVAKAARDQVPQGVLLNEPFLGATGSFEPELVNEALNRARVGLCLSAEEGAMYASNQYLLAGLPVVTTRNTGGRDEFFDPDHVLWVDDDAKAVADGVRELAAASHDPFTIRDRTLELMRPHRERLLGLLDELTNGNAGIWSAGWPDDVPNKLYDMTPSGKWPLFRFAVTGQGLEEGR